MYFAGKLVYLIVRPSNQLAINNPDDTGLFSIKVISHLGK